MLLCARPLRASRPLGHISASKDHCIYDLVDYWSQIVLKESQDGISWLIDFVSGYLLVQGGPTEVNYENTKYHISKTAYGILPFPVDHPVRCWLGYMWPTSNPERGEKAALLAKTQDTPMHAMRNFVVPCTLVLRWSLEVEWVLKNRSHKSQLLLAQVKRNQFLCSWAKCNCDSWHLFLSTHLTSILHCSKRVWGTTKLSVACVGVSWGLLLACPSRWVIRASIGAHRSEKSVGLLIAFVFPILAL